MGTSTCYNYMTEPFRANYGVATSTCYHYESEHFGANFIKQITHYFMWVIESTLAST